MAASPEASPAELEVPGYDLLERLGAGGFGEVFRARHRVIGREVAIKIIHERHCADPQAIARFVAEARAVNKISHPNIVEISDFGELANGRPYCVMELLHGRTLRAILDERAPLDLAEAVPILRGIAEAIDAAHAVGILHRDLKPDNVFVLADASIKLIDFGLAKLTTEDSSVTQTGQVFGTPLYMSPEQCRGRAVTPATDAYSFGALAYHVLTGVPPFSGEPLDLAVQHINDPPPAPTHHRTELPARVDAPLLALLAKDPALRPTRLVAAVDALDGGAALPSARRSRRWLVAAALALLGGGLAAIALSRGEAARESSWTRSTVRLDLDGIVYSPTVARDGSQLLYGDAAGWWRHDFATRRTVRLPIGEVREGTTVDELPDGRLLVATDRPRRTEIVDLRDRGRVPLIDAGFASLSPDGTQVAAWEAGNHLVIHDLATHQTRRLFQLPGGVIGSPPSWSPDGAQLLFGRSGTLTASYPIVFVTNVADGTTQALPHEVQPRLRSTTTEDYFSAVAFLRDGRIVYCADNPVRVVARPLWGTELTTLAELGSSVSDCMITARGGRIVVTVGHSQSTVAMFEIPPDLAGPLMPRQIAGPTRMQPVSADERRVYGYAFDTGERTLRGVDLETGEVTAERLCSGEQFFVRRGADMLHYTVDTVASTLRLLARDTCEVVDEWKLPPFERAGVPDCHPTWCVVATTHADHSRVWKLVRGEPAHERARFPSLSGDSAPYVALSADGSELAVMMHEPHRLALHVLDREGGAARTLPIRADFLDGVAWSADGQLLAAGQAVEGAPYALFSVARDGTQRLLWPSKSTYLSTLVVDPSRTKLFGRVATWQQEFLMLDQGDR